MARWRYDEPGRWRYVGRGVPGEAPTVIDVDRFLHERTLRLEHARVSAAELWVIFAGWCARNREDSPSPHWLARRLAERGYRRERSSAARYWRGLRVLNVTPSTTRQAASHLSVGAEHAASRSAGRVHEARQS